MLFNLPVLLLSPVLSLFISLPLYLWIIAYIYIVVFSEHALAEAWYLSSLHLPSTLHFSLHLLSAYRLWRGVEVGRWGRSVIKSLGDGYGMTSPGVEVTGKDFIFCMYGTSLAASACEWERVWVISTTYIIDDFELERSCIKVKELT